MTVILPALCIIAPCAVAFLWLGPDVARYARTRRNEQRRLDEWTAAVRREQDAAFESWRRRKMQARELTSRRIA